MLSVDETEIEAIAKEVTEATLEIQVAVTGFKVGNGMVHFTPRF